MKSIYVIIALLAAGTNLAFAEDEQPALRGKLSCTHRSEYGFALGKIELDLASNIGYSRADGKIDISWSETECEDSTELRGSDADFTTIPCSKGFTYPAIGLSLGKTV